MKEVDILFSITMVLFSISFSWMVTERINNFPKIRRFSAFYNLLFKFFAENVDRRKLKSDIFVLLSSWSIIIVFLGVSIELLLHYYNQYNCSTIQKIFINRFLVPFLFFIAPQFMSRLISSLVLWLAKSEIKRLWENDKEVFNIFSSGWKQEYDLTDSGIESGSLHEKCRLRSLASLLYVVVIYYFIYILVQL